MKDKRPKIEEPYTPEDTPQPPQIIDPRSTQEEIKKKKRATAGKENRKKPAPAKG